MKPRKRFNYVYVIMNLCFFRDRFVETCFTPHIADLDLFNSYNEAKKALYHDYEYWCDDESVVKKLIWADEPMRSNAGHFYVCFGGYRVDYADKENKICARVGKLFRYRL